MVETKQQSGEHVQSWFCGYSHSHRILSHLIYPSFTGDMEDGSAMIGLYDLIPCNDRNWVVNITIFWNVTGIILQIGGGSNLVNDI